MLEWSRGVPILIVTLARPELLDAATRLGRRHGATSLALELEPLAEAAMRELLAGLVPGLPGARRHASIVARADGIPLYAVETVRMLVADGRLREIDDGATSRSASSASWRCRRRSRRSSRRASTGCEPRTGPSSRTRRSSARASRSPACPPCRGRRPRRSSRGCARLVDVELLDQEVDPRSPERGQYAFVQALIREVAYTHAREARPTVTPPRGRPLLRIARRGRARRRARRPLRGRLRGRAGRTGGRCARGPGAARAGRGRGPRHGAWLTGAGDLLPDPGEGCQGRTGRAGHDPRAARPSRDRGRPPGRGRTAA